MVNIYLNASFSTSLASFFLTNAAEDKNSPGNKSRGEL